jgi:hypothetical protein
MEQQIFVCVYITGITLYILKYLYFLIRKISVENID